MQKSESISTLSKKTTTMATTSHTLRNRRPLQSDSPKFCTIILYPEADYLKVEDEFARRHGCELPRTVFFKVYESSKVWEIEVVKTSDGEVLFMDGWEEFKEYYSLKIGDFLVFKFDGSSSFDVFIYDMTSVHIDRVSDEEETGSESDEEISSDDTENSEDEGDSSNDQAGGSRIGRTRKFTRQLTIYELYTLRLPKSFIKGVLAHSYVMLKDESGRELKVNLVRRKGGKRVFGAGWKDFLINNKVTIGSTVSVEYISVPRNLVEVKVVKMASDKNMLFEYVKKKGGRPCIVVPRGQSRENPSGGHTQKVDTKNVAKQEGGSQSRSKCSFRRQITFSSRHRFELTKEFIKSSGISSHPELLLKNVRGMTWPVQNTCRSSGRCTLGSGWHDFLIDNEVIVGSTLEFKHSSDSQCILEVRVVKPGENRNELFKHAKRGAPRKR